MSYPRRLLRRCAQRLVTSCVGPALRKCGYHTAEHAQIDWSQDWCFEFRGTLLPYFFHRHNCGWPPLRCTERVVELAVADIWLTEHDTAHVVEVGAVSPYYWPGRVNRVIDPADPHPQVTERESVLDVDLAGTVVLSVSTIEHIGVGDYGLRGEDPALANAAFKKIVDESDAFLVTVPVGYNRALDDRLFNGEYPADVAVTFLRRTGNVTWCEEPDRRCARIDYGPRGANGLVVLSRNWQIDRPSR